MTASVNTPIFRGGRITKTASVNCCQNLKAQPSPRPSLLILDPLLSIPLHSPTCSMREATTCSLARARVLLKSSASCRSGFGGRQRATRSRASGQRWPCTAASGGRGGPSSPARSGGSGRGGRRRPRGRAAAAVHGGQRRPCTADGDGGLGRARRVSSGSPDGLADQRWAWRDAPFFAFCI